MVLEMDGGSNGAVGGLVVLVVGHVSVRVVVLLVGVVV